MIEYIGMYIANCDPSVLFGALLMSSLIGGMFTRKVGK